MSNLAGISITLSNRLPNKPLRGMAGVAVVITPFAVAKIVNKRGRGLQGASITLPDSRTFFSDSKGNVALPAMTVGDVLLVRKDVAGRLEYTWTGATQFTIVLHPPMPI